MKTILKSAPALLAAAFLLASPVSRADDLASLPSELPSELPTDLPTELPATHAPAPSATSAPSAMPAAGPATPSPDAPAPMAATPGALFASLDGAMFHEVAPGISRTPVWGDDTRGSYGAYTRFRPGLDNGRHTHPHDTWIVVLGGTYLYEDDTGRKSVAAGDFIRIPGGLSHWSGSDAKEGALFYEEAAGRFGILPVAR